MAYYIFCSFYLSFSWYFRGLDSSSCSSCVALLKKLASQGHTIVCTIHQPSALIFEMFDKLYTVVDGHCMYQGPVRELVPFLADQQLDCPSYHNPADYRKSRLLKLSSAVLYLYLNSYGFQYWKWPWANINVI